MIETIHYAELNSLERFIGIHIDQDLVIQLIIEDLTNMFNSLPVCTGNQPMIDNLITNYGLDYTYNSSDHDQLELVKMIEISIAKFEPRLKDVIIVPVIEPSNSNVFFKFRITATLISTYMQVPLIIESKITTYPMKAQVYICH